MENHAHVDSIQVSTQKLVSQNLHRYCRKSSFKLNIMYRPVKFKYMNRDTVKEISTQRHLKRFSPGSGRAARRPARCLEPASCPFPEAPLALLTPFPGPFFGRFSLPRSGHSFHLTCRCSLAPCDCGACKRPPGSPGARSSPTQTLRCHHHLLAVLNR